MTEARARWPALGAVVLVLVGLLPDTASFYGALFDDAYIYLRYADNVLNGCFLEWNCGAGRVEGFTSPLYLAMLTLLGAALDLERAASLLGIVTWYAAIIGAVLLPLTLRDDDAPGRPLLASFAIALCFVGDQLTAMNITSGMEGGLVALALVGLAWLSTSPTRLAAVAPWLVVVRPELGLATIFQPILGRDALKRAFIFAIVGFGTVTAVRLALFVDVLPNTFWAKSGGTADHLASGLDYVWTSLSRYPAFLLSLLAFFSPRRCLRYLAAVLWTWVAYFLWSGGDFYVTARLFAFLVPVGYFVGMTALVERLSALSSRTQTAAVIGLTVTAVAIGHGVRDRFAPGEIGFRNVAVWADTGRWLKRCLPDAPIAALPIGAIAYFSEAPVFDLVGLTDPVVAIDGERASGEHFVVGHERAHPRWSLSLEPAVIMFDVSGPERIDGSKRLDLMFAEAKLFEHMLATKAPHVALSAPVNDHTFQLLFVDPRAIGTLEKNGCTE